jgi:predicted phosphodiesterase
MRIRLLSDIHLELGNKFDLNFKKQADVVILAGDIGNPYDKEYIQLLRKLCLTHDKVFLITGNHEYYNHKSTEEIDDYIKNNIEDDNIHFLQMDSVIYKDIKFIGCTLWGDLKDKSLCKYINDFKYINSDDYIKLQQQHKTWLENELSNTNYKNCIKTCIITHHIPIPKLVNDEFKDEPLNCFYVSNVNVTNAKVWCYGHTHKSSCKKINNTIFHCNPKGYKHESSGWDIDYIFEI